MQLMKVCRVPLLIVLGGVVVLNGFIIAEGDVLNEISYWIFFACCFAFTTFQIMLLIQTWPLLHLTPFKHADSLDSELLNQAGASNSEVISLSVLQKILAVVCGLCCLAITVMSSIAVYFALTFSFNENPDKDSDEMIAIALCIGIAAIGLPAVIFNFASLVLKVVRHKTDRNQLLNK